MAIMRAATAPRKGWIRTFFGITLGRMLKWLLIAALLLALLLAIAFAMLSVVMVVTIGAASAASVWYVSTGADGVRPLP